MLLLAALIAGGLPKGTPVGAQSAPAADGWASVNGSTTGGAGGQVVTASNSTDLLNYIKQTSPLVIQINGSIAISGMQYVTSNKTIVGLGSTARITGGGFRLRTVQNVIISNITFADSNDDAIEITESSHHVWVHHNTFLPNYDGAVDVKRGSDYVTISWNHFDGTDKTSLVGHDDGNAAQDTGKLRITYHHNFFDGSAQRHPRVRFADPLHVYNNYYLNNSIYAIASTMDAGLVVEGNYFENVASPINVGYADSGPGRVVERNNIYVNSGAPQTAGTVTEPRNYYSYTLDNPANIPAIVRAGAGVGGTTPPPSTATNTQVAATRTNTTQAVTNLLLNGGFENDTNPADGKPDVWTAGTYVTRSNASVQSGSYSLRHAATGNNSYVISQVVSGIAAGASYSFSGWTNIPATSDTFTYRVEILWRNSSNSTLRTDLVRSFTAATGGWVQASGSYVAPTGTTNAVVRMNVSSLAATIYADTFRLSRGGTPPPTNTQVVPPTNTQVVPPTNTPDPVGTTLFSDNFEDGVADGWTTSGGSWSVGTDGSRVYQQTSTSSDARAQAGSTSWTNQAVQIRVKPVSFNGTDRFVAVLARAQSSTSYYYLTLRNSNRIELKKLVSGSSTTLASKAFTVTPGTWYTVKLEVVGTTLRGYINGVQELTATDSQFASGRAGVASFYASAVFDDALVTAPGNVATPVPTNTQVVPPTSTSVVPPTNTPTGPTPTQGPIDSSLVGFATVNALGQNGTTGGAGGPVVTVSSAAQFLDYIARPGPYVIQVQGTLTLPGPMHDVTSDKTIIGIGANAVLTGGGLNIGLPIDNAITSPPANAVHNVIVRNLHITNCPDDCVNIQMFSHHVWIDHNDFSNQYDGALDAKRGSDFITISWNHFYNSDKNMLLGHDDSNGAQDIGRLRVTYHHNFFDGSNQRNPRVRFGEPVHIYNNYYLNNSGYGAASQMNAGLVVEGNYYDNVNKPTRNDVGGDPGRIVVRNNIAVNSDPFVAAGSVVEPRTYYSYSVDNPANIPAIVRAGAGVGKI